jgi:glyoxylase-like metal-dependent hydrolase (beta-lactamase superfamily II)
MITHFLKSHAHWDHSRPIRDEFPNATAHFGPGTKDGCSPGHLADPNVQWDGRYFDPERATERWKELDGPWTPFGPFEKAMDYFGDGSFWVIQAPGHMAGNLCAAAKVDGGHWILLGSDCCHSR